MNLALIRREFSATGGAELYVQRLLLALRKAGHELHLFAESWSARPEGIVLHPVSSGGNRAERPVRFADAVERELARHQFDCVLSLERTRRQDIYRAGDGLHREWLKQRKRFAPWWRKPFVDQGGFHSNMKALEAQTFNPDNTRHVIVNSDMVRREILANFKFPEERIHLVRNGVDVAHYQSGNRKALRQKYGIHDNEFLLLFAGSGWERKGLKFLLQAYESMTANNIRLLIVGKGKKPTFTPQGVIFTGPIDDVRDAYHAADLLVFLPVYEPSSNVVYEALASDLAVVTTKFNGASEIIREGKNGTVLPDPSDIPAVVKAIEKWRARRGSIETTPKEELSLERNVRETLAVIDLAMTDKGT